METISVIHARHVRDYRIEVEFSDGIFQVIDFQPQLERLRVPEYTKYREMEHFKSFTIENGNLVWGEDWDLIFPVDQLYDKKIA